MLEALLVEDEPAAMRHLMALLEQHPQVRVQAQAHCLEQAIAAVQAAPPDLVFLDLRLGSVHGSALLSMLPGACQVVITTAYRDFAIQAFDAGVRDYLLKPVRPERLALCLERLLAARTDADTNDPGSSDTEGFWVDRSGWHDQIRLDAVLWVVAMGKSSHLQLVDRDPLVVNRLLGDWDALLPVDQFPRLDRSTIVSLSGLRTVKRVSRSLTLLFFHGFEQPLAIGPTAARRLKELLANQ